MKGILSQTLNWITHPMYSDSNIGDWVAGLLLIIIVSFLWSRVVTQIE